MQIKPPISPHVLWDAQITLNANASNSTIMQRNYLCPIDGVNNSTALTAWALSNLLIQDVNYTLGDNALCIRPNLKSCAIETRCADSRQAFLQLKNGLYSRALNNKKNTKHSKQRSKHRRTGNNKR